MDRKCLYCKDNLVDDEKHFILFCKTFQIKRQCFLSRLNVLNPKVNEMTNEECCKSDIEYRETNIELNRNHQKLF